MPKVTRQIVYPHPTFEPIPVDRCHNYDSLLNAGHEARKAAGRFDRCAKQLAGQPEITADDIAGLLAAMDQELEGTGRPDGLNGELEMFAQTWGFKFDSEAGDAIRERIEFEFAGLAGRASTTSELNGQFYEAVADHVITSDEVAALTQEPGYQMEGARADNLARLYDTPSLTWRGSALVDFRSKLQDQTWLKRIDLRRALQKAKAARPGDQDAAVAAVLELAVESYDSRKAAAAEVAEVVKAAFETPLGEIGLSPAAQGRLNSGIDDTGVVNDDVARIRALEQVTVADIEQLRARIEWAVGHEVPTELLQSVREGIAVYGLPYWNDPRFDAETIEALDGLVVGDELARCRARLAGLDTLAVLDHLGWELVPDARNITFRTSYTFGDPDEGDLLEMLIAKTSQYADPEISVRGLIEGKTLTLSSGPQTYLHDGTSDRPPFEERDEEGAPSLEAILENDHLRDAIHALMNHAIGTAYGAVPFSDRPATDWGPELVDRR